MGRVLQTDVSCAAVTVHIAAGMRRRLCEDIIKQEKKISILIDESTTVSRLSVLTVHLRATVGDSDEPVTFFLDLIELQQTTAACITETLLNCLHKHGFEF